MKKFLLLVCVSLLFAGCATERLYYWGDYSRSLYKYKKAPTVENAEAHKKTLLNIIQESEKQNKRVPPGVCCEYGFILLKEGNTKEALYYFDLEEQNYPESKVFVGRLKESVPKRRTSLEIGKSLPCLSRYRIASGGVWSQIVDQGGGLSQNV